MKNWIIISVLFLLTNSCCGSKSVTEPQITETEKDVNAKPENSMELPVKDSIVDTLDLKIENKEVTSSTFPEDNIEKIAITEVFDHSIFNNLLQKFVTDQGNVNYNGFRNERTTLRNYIDSLGDNMPDDSWSKEDKLAYWINAYNALTIDLILQNPGLNSIKDIDKPWNQRLWKLGNKWYNLDEIEHQILRKMNEPRIHFAIVCASVSCPKLQNKVFTALNLDDQLNAATKEFLSDSSKNKLSRDKIQISKIFKWFAKDFKQGQSLISFLNKYSDIQISQNANIKFMDYNWSLND